MADAPTGFEFNLHIPQNDDPDGLAEANLRTTVVRLPDGMTANPAFAAGLDACSSAEIGLTTPIGVSPPRFTEQSPRCPDASKLGPVEIESPLLENPLKGAAYLAEPYDNPYESFLMLYITVEDRERGVVVKLPGANRTGSADRSDRRHARRRSAASLRRLQDEAGRRPARGAEDAGPVRQPHGLRDVHALELPRRTGGEDGGHLRRRPGRQRDPLQQ